MKVNQSKKKNWIKCWSPISALCNRKICSMSWIWKILETLNSNFVLLHVRHYAFTLTNKFSAEGRHVFLGNLVHHYVFQYFFAVAKEFLAVGTRDSFPVLLRLFVFLNITQFNVIDQFCIINLLFLTESIFIVVCLLFAGLRLCFK